MLEYDKIDISEVIAINQTNPSKECNIFHYLHFLHKSFKYEPYFCNDCHDLIQKAVNFVDVAIALVKRNDYRIHY